MNGEVIDKRQNWVGRVGVLSPTGVALVLAYVHKTRPCYVARNRLFRPRDLRQMALWLGESAEGVRSVRRQKLLAAYVVLLEGMNLWEHTAVGWYVSPLAGQWLHASRREQWVQIAEVIGRAAWHRATKQRPFNAQPVQPQRGVAM